MVCKTHTGLLITVVALPVCFLDIGSTSKGKQRTSNEASEHGLQCAESLRSAFQPASAHELLLNLPTALAHIPPGQNAGAGPLIEEIVHAATV